MDITPRSEIGSCVATKSWGNFAFADLRIAGVTCPAASRLYCPLGLSSPAASWEVMTPQGKLELTVRFFRLSIS